MSENFEGLVVEDSEEFYLCFITGWRCADLGTGDVRALRDYLTEWLGDDEG